MHNTPFNQTTPNYPIAPPHTQPDYLTTLRNVPNIQIDKGTNYQFPKTETLPQNMGSIGLPMMPPYQNVPPPQNKFNQKPPTAGFAPNQNNAFPNQQGPYQNISFPPSHPFNSWGKGEIPPNQSRGNPNWWPNMSQPPPSGPPPQQPPNYRPEGYSMQFPLYTHFFSPQVSKHDFNKPANSQHGGGDIFNSSNSHWGSFSGNFLGDNGNMGFNNTNQGMSMRQAMLKEAMPNAPVGPPGPPSGSVRRLPNVPMVKTIEKKVTTIKCLILAPTNPRKYYYVTKSK